MTNPNEANKIIPYKVRACTWPAGTVQVRNRNIRDEKVACDIGLHSLASHSDSPGIIEHRRLTHAADHNQANY